MNDNEQKLQSALLEIERLKQENENLRRALSVHQSGSLPAETAPSLQIVPEAMVLSLPDDVDAIHQYSSPGEKIGLFRSLFKGREDVYPVRWENKTGKAGYSPVCGNEWTSVCKKPQVKCSECSHKRFLPVTDEAVSQHLNSKVNRTMGIYPMLADETCRFLAMDFDKRQWQEDALAVMKVCKEYDIPAALERSRSGQGGTCMDFFSGEPRSQLSEKAGLCPFDKNHGQEKSTGFRLIRPAFSQSGYAAQRRVWEFGCPSSTRNSQKEWQ